MRKLLEYYEDHMISCVYKKVFGFECPWCGMQRSFYYLLKGELIESIKTFPALIPMLLMLIFLIFHLIFKIKNGHKILLYMFYLTSGLIIINYLIKIIN
ncbi:MAG: DUF2752 domain-containing protein [Bacteroidales bacterium]|nr:DUF2752 domain-containing protein [Bacteroidales bacterium]MBN2821122.1 DUF2752 domain-containing protein [Bacteroidales bacterium]